MRRESAVEHGMEQEGNNVSRGVDHGSRRSGETIRSRTMATEYGVFVVRRVVGVPRVKAGHTKEPVLLFHRTAAALRRAL